jgi:hypothetical protein
MHLLQMGGLTTGYPGLLTMTAAAILEILETSTPVVTVAAAMVTGTSDAAAMTAAGT